MDQKNFSISNTTKRKLPRLRFAHIKEAVVGKKYDLSLVFVGKQKIQTLNRIYRSKDSPTDILSFPVSDTMGEIYICRDMSDKKAKEFERTENNYLEFVFVHGLVHLLGHDHGEKMEKLETKFRKKFSI
jgi:probable rRNA maturation factor